MVMNEDEMLIDIHLRIDGQELIDCSMRINRYAVTYLLVRLFITLATWAVWYVFQHLPRLLP